jgi:hypothetical protein
MDQHLDRGANHIDWYMQFGFPAVEGWCHPLLADFAKLIDQHQQQSGISGGVAEVGVHHGKLLMLLNSFCSNKEKSYAIDVFARQELNVDHSGSGSQQIFQENLQKYDRHSGSNVSIVADDSLTLNFEKTVQAPVRMFSVDGGHTAEHTISDLKNAQSCIHPNGVVILDDILNHHWLGVIEGALHFLNSRPTLVPVAIGVNKLFLTNFSYADNYRALFRGHPAATKFPVRFCGFDIVALG